MLKKEDCYYIVGKLKNNYLYVNSCLLFVLNTVEKRHPRRNNAPGHSVKETNPFLSTVNAELMGYQLYTPDLAPYDFYFFPETKNKL